MFESWSRVLNMPWMRMDPWYLSSSMITVKSKFSPCNYLQTVLTHKKKIIPVNVLDLVTPSKTVFFFFITVFVHVLSRLFPRRIMCHPDKVLEVVVVSTTAPVETGVINNAAIGARRVSNMEHVSIPLFLISLIFAIAFAIKVVRGWEQL